ncbi:hypothetical protein [uncultured Polaribacter sp.]|uniref:hypothetical protein n=1 Tax=uncultured Polaribacter sp. TaxID=174711 RepID=UPI002627D15B|nr:hypothetical protein [uncultured Polaribacter sp.]
MKFKINTYRTLTGIKKVVEIPTKKYHQWLIYRDNKPSYFVDFYDLEKESNAMMNSLVWATDNSIEEVLEKINKKNNVNLSIPKIIKNPFKRKIKSTVTQLDLPTLPKEWLSYSL